MVKENTSPKYVIAKAIKYTLGIIFFGACFMMLFSSVKLDLFFPFNKQLLETMDIYKEGSTLFSLVEIQSDAGFWNFVLLRAFAIPVILFFGLGAIGHIFVMLRKLFGDKRVVDVIFCVSIASLFLYMFIPAMKVIWHSGFSTKILLSVVVFSSLIDILFFMFLPYFLKLSDEGESIVYWKVMIVISGVLCVYLAVEFLLSYCGLVIVPTLMQFLLFLVALVFPFCIKRVVEFITDDLTVPSYSYYSSGTTSSYNNYYDNYHNGNSSNDSEKRNIYSHYDTKISYYTSKENENGTCDIDYDATFYFRNDEGDEETKTASGRFYFCRDSSDISVSDVEYRHRYMLGDYER